MIKVDSSVLHLMNASQGFMSGIGNIDLLPDT